MCSWITASAFNYRRSRIYLIWLSLYTSIPSFNILYPFDTRLQTNTNSMHIRIYFSNFIIIKNYTINIIHQIILYATYIYNPPRKRIYLESLDIESNMNSFDTRRRKQQLKSTKLPHKLFYITLSYVQVYVNEL